MNRLIIPWILCLHIILHYNSICVILGKPDYHSCFNPSGIEKRGRKAKKHGAWIHLPYRVAGVISHLANMSTYRHHLPYNFGRLADSSFYGLTCYQRPKMTVRESISGVSELTNGVGGLTSWRSDWIGRFSAIHKNKLPQNKTSQVNFLWNFATLLHL